jgi:hypothetical protein
VEQKGAVETNDEPVKLEAQKEELQTLLQNVQIELDTLEEDLDFSKKERQAEITREILQGNMGVDDDIVVEEEANELDEDEANMDHGQPTIT